MKRLQRLRSNQILRDMMSQTDFNASQLIQPLFIVEDLQEDESILGLPGVARQGIDKALETIEKDLAIGVKQFLLFYIPTTKVTRLPSFKSAGKAIEKIKSRFSGESLSLWVDTCLCSSTVHGHCCILNKDGSRDHKETLQALGLAAVTFAGAGADGISPSDMMDGRTAFIREQLDHSGFEETPIMSYSTKFASHFYGPFRNAADSAPQHGDRKGYQIDVRNLSDAMQSSLRCAHEGADLLMVKPGMTSIDLIMPITEKTGLAVGAYQVSGEYASLHFLAEKGLLTFDDALLETWHVFKRAGAQFIITYGAREGRRLLLKSFGK